MIAPISNSAIPKTIAAPSPGRGGAAHESKVIPTAVVAKTRTAFCIRDFPRARLGAGQELSRMSYQKVTDLFREPEAICSVRRKPEARTRVTRSERLTIPVSVRKPVRRESGGDFYRHGRGTRERRSSVRKSTRK